MTSCRKPEIAHGAVVGKQENTYKLWAKIELRCNPRYEPERFFVTCKQNGEWDNMQQCKCKYQFILYNS